MIGTYGPCAEFIKLAHKAGFHPTFVNVSFVGANALAKELGAAGEGVVVSQVVPFPWDTSLKVVADYQGAQKALDPSLSPGFVSLEGYLSGRLTAAALELAGPHPTRAGLLRAINEVGRFDISGSVITVGPGMQDAPPPRSSSPSFRRTAPSRLSTGCNWTGAWASATACGRQSGGPRADVR
jgi:branched-chain amino acid transport system substrate-binding protein